MSEQGAPVPPPVAPQESTVKAAGKSIGKRIVIYIVLAIVGLGVYFGYNYFTGDISTAKVGDCVTKPAKADDAPSIVDCAKAEAQQKVVSIIEGKYTYTEFGKLVDTPCPGGEDAYFQGTSKRGVEKKGDVWCLAPKA